MRAIEREDSLEVEEPNTGSRHRRAQVCELPSRAYDANVSEVCELPSRAYDANVSESARVGSNFESFGSLDCYLMSPSECRLVIEPEIHTSDACAQFRPSINKSIDEFILSVALSLDFERPDMRLCVGMLALYSNRTNGVISRQKLRIQVLDANDIPPLFTQKTFNFTVNESEHRLAPFELPVRDCDSTKIAQFVASVHNVSCFYKSRYSGVTPHSERYCRERFHQLFRIDVLTAEPISIHIVSTESIVNRSEDIYRHISEGRVTTTYYGQRSSRSRRRELLANHSARK